MLKRKFKKTVVFTCAAMLAMGTIGAGSPAFGASATVVSSSKNTVKGRLLVSAGPDISISYNKNGTVLDIEGTDRQGKDFLKGQDGYVGESCEDAVRLLVRRLDDDGWFDTDAGGRRRSLIVRAEKDSVYPYDRFMEDIKDEIHDVAAKRDIDAYIRVVDTQEADNKGYIDKATAEEIVLDLFGLKADNLKIKDYDLDDGVYEVEVLIKGVEHEVELNAVTGEVLEVNQDKDYDGRYDDDDDDDDRDDRYDDDRYDDDRDDDDRYDDDRYDDDRYDDDHDDDDHDDDDDRDDRDDDDHDDDDDDRDDD